MRPVGGGPLQSGQRMNTSLRNCISIFSKPARDNVRTGLAGIEAECAGVEAALVGRRPVWAEQFADVGRTRRM